MQQLLDNQLDWDTYYSHNTGGEHANRVIGHESSINKLRERSGLVPIENLDIFKFAYNDGYVFVSNNEGKLIAYLIALNDCNGTYTIEYLVVDSDYSGIGLGKFVLGTLASKSRFIPPSSILGAHTVTVAQEITNEAPLLKDWFISRGFSIADSNENPSLKLPGQNIINILVNQIEMVKQKMPPNWNGTLNIVDSNHQYGGWIEVFRNGNPVGKLTKKTYDIPATRLWPWQQYEFEFESGQRDNGLFTTDTFAAIALLNHTYTRNIH